VLSGKATAVPKAGDTGVEMVRALKIAKRTAIKARTQAENPVKGIVVMEPDPIREQLRNLKTPALVRTCSAYRVDGASDPTSAIKLSLRSMCRRYVALDQEVRLLEKELDALTVCRRCGSCPSLLCGSTQRRRIGRGSAGRLLVRESAYVVALLQANRTFRRASRLAWRPAAD